MRRVLKSLAYLADLMRLKTRYLFYRFYVHIHVCTCTHATLLKKLDFNIVYDIWLHYIFILYMITYNANELVIVLCINHYSQYLILVFSVARGQKYFGQVTIIIFPWNVKEKKEYYPANFFSSILVFHYANEQNLFVVVGFVCFLRGGVWLRARNKWSIWQKF